MITLPIVTTLSGARHSAQVGLARVVVRHGRELARLERGPARQLFLHTIVLILPRRFDTKEARDLDVVLEIRLRRPDGDEYDPITITIKNKTCRVRLEHAPDPDTTVSLAIPDLVRMATGATEVPPLWTDGRVKITGDPFLLAYFLSLFRCPTKPLV